MANVELAKYVQAARAQGVSDESIKSQLLQAGWKDSDIIEAFPQVVSGITLPIPPAPHASMWISFQYILLFISAKCYPRNAPPSRLQVLIVTSIYNPPKSPQNN